MVLRTHLAVINVQQMCFLCSLHPFTGLFYDGEIGAAIPVINLYALLLELESLKNAYIEFF